MLGIKQNFKGKWLRMVIYKIVQQTEDEYQLEPRSLRLRTVRARVDCNNLTGIAPQRISPLISSEPLIVEYCTRLANMGAPLWRDQAIILAESLISGTDLKDEFIKFKKIALFPSWFRKH